jgi:hypothetical protein
MIHAIKLSMIASADRGGDMCITALDFQQALEWMMEAEDLMPQVFLHMAGKSDNQTMAELYHYAQSMFESPLMRGQLIRKGLLVNFLSRKVPAYSVDKVLDVAVGSGYLGQVMTSTGEIMYKPLPKPGLYVAPKRPN